MKSKASKLNVTPISVEDRHQLLLWLIPLLDQFPRQRHFTLGKRLKSVLSEVWGQQCISRARADFDNYTALGVMGARSLVREGYFPQTLRQPI